MSRATCGKDRWCVINDYYIKFHALSTCFIKLEVNESISNPMHVIYTAICLIWDIFQNMSELTISHKQANNRMYHPGGHYFYHYPFILSLSQVMTIHLKIFEEQVLVNDIYG